MSNCDHLNDLANDQKFKNRIKLSLNWGFNFKSNKVRI